MYALILTLAREMLNKGSWCGETHLQKAVYFLKEVFHIPIDFEYILYKYGPFSFELRDELTEMRACSLFELMVKETGYGPSYVPTPKGGEFLEKHQGTISDNLQSIDEISEKLGKKDVKDLEGMATALWIIRNDRVVGHNPDAITKEVTKYKPQIKDDDARESVKLTLKIISDANKSM